MSDLRAEIQEKYLDAFGMIMPRPSTPDTQMGSDNGILFTSEYIVLLSKLGELSFEDKYRWFSVVSGCLNSCFNLKRGSYTDAQDSVDNHYGLFAAAKVLGLSNIPKLIKKGMFSNWGFSNNEVPGTIRHKDGTINWDAFLIRQPQLVTAMISACNEKKWYHFPLYVYSALVIATSCMFKDIHATDERKLCYMLIQSVSPDSWLCRMAAKLWFRRLKRQYNSNNPMHLVYGIYFGFDHPMSKYAITT